MYLTIKKTFSVDDYRHYSFTPKSLFEIFKDLSKYEFTSQEELLEAIANEFNQNYRNKVVSQEMKTKFEQTLMNSMRTHFRFTPKSDTIFTSMSGKFMKIKTEDYLSILKSALIQFEREYK